MRSGSLTPSSKGTFQYHDGLAIAHSFKSIHFYRFGQNGGDAEEIRASQIDMRTSLFGVTYDSPIFICPTGSNKAFHADGEVAVARAAKTGNHLQMLSTVATTSIKDAIAARDVCPPPRRAARYPRAHQN